MKEKPLVVLSEALDHYFLLTRLGLGKALLGRGIRVVVLAGDTGYGQEIRQQGFEFWPLPAKPKGFNPVGEIRILASYLKAYYHLRPALTHHFTPRPIVYGSLAARLLKMPYVNTITGLGYTFTDNAPTLRRRLTRFLGSKLFQMAVGAVSCRTVVQNPDDYDFVKSQAWTTLNKLYLIRSSGVDCQRFQYCQERPSETIQVVMPGRILWDKGVREFVEACRWLRQAGETKIQMVLVGEPDPKHPTSVPLEELQAWVNQGLLTWLGFQNDMVKVFSDCHIVVLPSYREGFPKALLEAAACGRPLVGADVPGVREIVQDNQNGFLVPVRDGIELAKAIQKLAQSAQLRTAMGQVSRELAVSCSIESVVKQTFEVYAGIPEVSQLFPMT